MWWWLSGKKDGGREGLGQRDASWQWNDGRMAESNNVPNERRPGRLFLGPWLVTRFPISSWRQPKSEPLSFQHKGNTNSGLSQNH